MSLARVEAAQALSGTVNFDAVIDVRSPAEFADDHLPGALNWPVLDDAERARVGLLYKQISPHEARKVGAAIVARRIAEHIERSVIDQPREWRPLVYCWRGGQRSGSLALVLSQIGFRVGQLVGGYRAYRVVVRDQLDTLPSPLQFVVLCGRTGSGKTRLLQALGRQGAQALDLEGLANHRGSLLGAMGEQPTQKRFDSLVWQALRGFDPARPVFIESESARIGNLRVPPVLLDRLRSSGRCVRVQMADTARIGLLTEEYAALIADVEACCRALDPLIALRGRALVSSWQTLARGGRFAELIGALMAEHYDPLYERSMKTSFASLADAPVLELPDGTAASLDAAARGLTGAPSCFALRHSHLGRPGVLISPHVQAAVAGEIGPGGEA